MKKRLRSIAMILMVVLAFAACGQEPAETPDGGDVNAADAYGALLEQISGEIEADSLDESQLEGAYSLYVALGHLDAAEKLAAAGYRIEDINGDGTPELLIGMVGDRIIFNLYTLSEGEPVLVFEGFARNAYSLMEGGKFAYHGSSSAASSAFGIFSLPAGGTKLECEEFRFSEIKPGTDTEIGFYYNTSGLWVPEESEELTVSEEEFWAMSGELLEQVKPVELTPFAG